jgi:hypothetical protein
MRVYFVNNVYDVHMFLKVLNNLISSILLFSDGVKYANIKSIFITKFVMFIDNLLFSTILVGPNA